MIQFINAARVKAIAGKAAKPDLVNAIVRGWPDAVRVAKLTSPRRAAHFLAQILTETGGLTILSESGAYSASRISEIFGVGHHSAAVTPSEAHSIAALPVAQRGPVLFNRVYGRGNPRKAKEFNNTEPNDGWLYRGGGMMQCTGKSNYAAMAKKTGMPLVEHPELLHNPDSAFKVAYLEWAQDGRCNAAADRNNVVQVRKIINGGDNGLVETKRYLATALNVLRDYQGEDEPAPPAAAVDLGDHDDVVEHHGDEDQFEPVPMPEPRPAEAPPNVQPVDSSIRGDPVLFDVQQRLKRRRYPPGVMDGKWGSGTSGALSGFMNDRGNRLDPAPTSVDEFHEIADQVRDELLEAETEKQPDGSIGWFRPVSEARANGDPKILKELAPESVPQRRGFLASAWAAVLTFVTAIWTAISDKIQWLFGYFSDNKDSLPTDPGYLSMAWGYLAKVPLPVWVFAGGVGLTFIAINIFLSARKIEEDVKTGARQ